MFRFLLLTNLLVIVLGAAIKSSDDNLKTVVVLYRHGDRAPLKPYATDPFDESYWPLGLGQLTNTGKKHQYELGEWLRQRYYDFLPATYNKKDIKIQSSNVDRCLMSAELNLAGLYPPEGNQVWNDKLKWQPIPIHTVPEVEDPVLAQGKACAKYDILYQQLMEDEPFKSILANYSDQMKNFSEASGDNITTLEDLQYLYNTVFIENLNNLTLPSWTKDILTEEIENLCGEAWATYAYTEDLARLSSGTLIDAILNHFEDISNNVDDTPEFLMLSAHDSTIASLLTAMKVFDNKWPYFASSVLFELRQGEGNGFVNIFYRNPTDLTNITLPECDFNCDFDRLQTILEPIRINLEDWDSECQTV